MLLATQPKKLTELTLTLRWNEWKSDYRVNLGHIGRGDRRKERRKNCDTKTWVLNRGTMAKKNMKKEMQDILENEDYEEMAPGSDSVHTGVPSSSSASAAAARARQSGRTTPPNSLAVMPG